MKLSKTSKLDGIRSWSLQARETCPTHMLNGVVVDACAGCYATTGNYYLPNVIKVRAENKLAWQEKSWVADMVAELANDTYFRWFDSGDIYHIHLAQKIHDVIQLTPHVKHWLPTRMARLPKFKSMLDSIGILPNVMVRHSSDSICGEFESHHGSVIIGDASQLTSDMFMCRAYEHGGKCNGCRACYSKDVSLIAYPAHGRKIKKVIRLRAVG